MSESDDASRARPVDNSPIGVYRAELNRINGELKELNDKIFDALSDGTKNKAQLDHLGGRIKELKDEKEKKEAELKELLTEATTARQKRTYGEVAQSPMTLPAAAQPTEAGPKRSGLHIRYKSDAAVKHMRAFLTKVAQHLVKTGLVPPPARSGWSSTYGDVQVAYKEGDAATRRQFEELLSESTWEYLDDLNSWCNRQLHEIRLPKVGGFVRLVCHADCLDEDAIREAAKMLGMNYVLAASD